MAANYDELKHLVIVMQLFDIVCRMYEAAKKKSEPLKCAADNVESLFSYDMFKTVPKAILVFFDKQVGNAAPQFDKIAPSTVKTLVNIANELITAAVKWGDKLVDEVIDKGLWAGYEYAAAEESKNIFVAETVKAWIMLEENSIFRMVGGCAIPIADYCALIYNVVIKGLSDKGLNVFKYFPLAPVEEIKKKYEAEKKGCGPTSPSEKETTTSNADEVASPDSDK